MPSVTIGPLQKVPGMPLRGGERSEVGKQGLQEEELKSQLDHKRELVRGKGIRVESGLVGLSKGGGKVPPKVRWAV